MELRTVMGLLSLALGLLVWWLSPLIKVVGEVSNGYGAKLACSAVFVSLRPLQSVIDAELVFPPIRYVTTLTVNHTTKCVTASNWLSEDRLACWKSARLGCSLVSEGAPSIVSIVEDPAPPMAAHPDHPQADALWPYGSRVDTSRQGEEFEGVDFETIDALVKEHFADSLNARAFLIVRHGRIIYEHYGDGCSRDTPLLGWSMTKSIVNAIVGRLVHQGILTLDTKIELQHPDWHLASHSLTLRDALRMQDGLDFDERYEPGFAVTDMLFRYPHVVNTSSPPQWRVPPRRCFQYSSQTTNLISRFLRHVFEQHASLGGTQGYLQTASSLFEELGQRSAVLETDPHGSFVGSSFSYMTAQDWARFGLLYLNDGMWQALPTNQPVRLLPEGWVNFSSTPTTSSDQVYGAHFWLSQPPAGDEHREAIRSCDQVFPTRLDPPRGWIRQAFPIGTFLAHGFEEQCVAVMPSRRVVLVRLGASKEWVNWTERKVRFYSGITKAIPDVPHT